MSDDCTQADYDEFASNYKRFLSKTEERKNMPKAERRKLTTTWEGPELADLRFKWPTEKRIRKVVQYLNDEGLFKCIVFMRDGSTRFPGLIDHMGIVDSMPLYNWLHEDPEWKAEIEANQAEWMSEWNKGTQMRGWETNKHIMLRSEFYGNTRNLDTPEFYQLK